MIIFANDSHPNFKVNGRVEIRANEYSDTLIQVDFNGGWIHLAARKFTVLPIENTSTKA